MNAFLFKTAFIFLAIAFLPFLEATEISHGDFNAPPFPKPIAEYGDSQIGSVGAKLLGRIHTDPFNAVATTIFFAAIIHTFLAGRFLKISHKLEHEHEAIKRSAAENPQLLSQMDRKKFLAVLFHYLGEVEVVFGIWIIPLTLAIICMKGLGTAKNYINTVNFTEPIFVMVIMAIASSRPVLQCAESALQCVATLGKKTTAAWWLAILTVGPLLGSFITEPAAMTICALLLVDKFFKCNPSMPLRYATLGLLFVNISIGGTLTHFAAPPIVMVASKWQWDTLFMLQHFGFEAVAALLVSNGIAFFIFRRELLSLHSPETHRAHERPPVPALLILAHLGFIGFVVFTAHYAALVGLAFLFFLAFVSATKRHQDAIPLRSPVLVGFFLAGLVIHGGCQQWWIEPVLTSLNPVQMLLGATLLTSFNDNAAITYLASLVPGFSDAAKHAVVAGAVAGGGLTVIANAPNPAGQSILQSYFGEEGVNALKLALAALGPTIVCVLMFLLKN